MLRHGEKTSELAKGNLGTEEENDKLDQVDECVTLLPASRIGLPHPPASGQDQRGCSGRNWRGREGGATPLTGRLESGRTASSYPVNSLTVDMLSMREVH